MKRKTFKDNASYFKFYNSMRDIIKILSIKITDKIKIVYELNEIEKTDKNIGDIK